MNYRKMITELKAERRRCWEVMGCPDTTPAPPLFKPRQTGMCYWVAYQHEEWMRRMMFGEYLWAEFVRNRQLTNAMQECIFDISKKP